MLLMMVEPRFIDGYRGTELPTSSIMIIIIECATSILLLTMIFFRVKFDIRFFYRIGILEYFCGIMKSSIFRRPEIEFYVSWP